MADENLTQKTAATTLGASALLYAVISPFGSTEDRKITYQNAISLLMANPGQLFGGQISVTLSGTNLVLAIKTTAGNDPSASEPVFVNIAGTVRAITSATSTTKNAGTNWGAAGSANFAALPIDWFAHVVWRSAGNAVHISASRWPGGNIVSDFSSTTTNERHLFDHTTFTASDRVEVCGRFQATLSAAAGHNWSIPTYSAGDNIVYVPIRETRWLTYAPTISQGYSAAPSNALYLYRLCGRNAEIMFREATAGTSNTTGTGIYSLPFTVATITNSLYGYVLPMTDNGTLFVGYCTIVSAATTVVFQKIGGWTNTGNRHVNFTPPILYRTAA